MRPCTALNFPHFVISAAQETASAPISHSLNGAWALGAPTTFKLFSCPNNQPGGDRIVFIALSSSIVVFFSISQNFLKLTLP
jgi:hypothetical protein